MLDQEEHCRDKTETAGSRRKDTAGKQDQEKYRAGGEGKRNKARPAESNGAHA